jgi:murein DD-endopeptidase MepM/ murein hydrolase activator NlpD
MKQEYFVVVLAHSLRGRLRRIHIPHQAVYAILVLALLGCFSVFGFVASYARMAWKVANYNALRREADNLRSRYQTLLKTTNEKESQLATLQLLAKEMTVAYGIKQKLEGPSDISHEGKLVPTFSESLRDYDFLRRARTLDLASKPSRRLAALMHVIPSIYPVEGRFMDPFGQRTDPFSGEGAFHKGIDISAPTGTPVHVTADGVVVFAAMESGFGRLIVVDHGGGMQTYYAHLSRFLVYAGQEVRRGDEIGEVGRSGRTTAPHLHYEVHLGGNAVNPASYLQTGRVAQAVHTRTADLFGF